MGASGGEGKEISATRYQRSGSGSEKGRGARFAGKKDCAEGTEVAEKIGPPFAWGAQGGRGCEQSC